MINDDAFDFSHIWGMIKAGIKFLVELFKKVMGWF